MSRHYMIDLFSGAGGLSCGLEQAGFFPVLANELIEQYANTYKENHKETEVITGDIRACLETHLSIMKRFNSMLAMAI